MNKLHIINRALIGTGNNPINELNNGSTNAAIAEVHFGRALDHFTAEFNWPFSLKFAELQQSGTSDHPDYDYAWTLPADSWHIKAVHYKTGGLVSDYRLATNLIHTNTNDVMKVEYLIQPEVDGNWHPKTVEALTTYMESLFLKSPNEDYEEARLRGQEAELLLGRAKTLVSQQSPNKNKYSSRMRRARMTRRV